MQRTCILVKPDGVGSRRVGAVVDRLERADLRLIGMKMTRLDRSKAEAFYKEHAGKPFYEGLISFMTATPIVATAWEGPEAISVARALMGGTNSPLAAAGTLRREFGTDNRYNLVHGSDAPASAEREISFFFNPDELYTYRDNDWRVSDGSLRS